MVPPHLTSRLGFINPGLTLSLLGVYYKSMDWFKGNLAGNPHDLDGKIDGFRLRCSQQNQSIE